MSGDAPTRSPQRGFSPSWMPTASSTSLSEALVPARDGLAATPTTSTSYPVPPMRTTTDSPPRWGAGCAPRVGGMTDDEARQLPVIVDAATLRAFGSSTWTTDAGPLDILLSSLIARVTVTPTTILRLADRRGDRRDPVTSRRWMTSWRARSLPIEPRTTTRFPSCGDLLRDAGPEDWPVSKSLRPPDTDADPDSSVVFPSADDGERPGPGGSDRLRRFPEETCKGV